NDLQKYLDSWIKESCYIKIFKKANKITKYDSGPLNDCANAISSYQFINRLKGSKPTNKFGSTVSQNNECVIFDSNFNVK
ncbi:6353_t:CDS:1, partial [Dentiscutata heterogama]